MTLIDSIVSSSKSEIPPRIVLYGVHGIGKSTWASQAKYKPIYVPTEDGLRHLNVNSFPLAKTWTEYMQYINAVMVEDHEFKTLVIDSIDWAEKLCESFVADRAGKETIMDIGFGKGHASVRREFGEMLAKLDVINRDRNMVVILLGHCKIQKFESPMLEPYDRYSLKLHDKVASLVEEWCDAELFVNYKVHVKKSDNAMRSNKAIGGKERIVHCNEGAAYQAKNRYGLPDTMNFSYDEILGAVFKKIREKAEDPFGDGDDLPQWDLTQNNEKK